MRSPNNPVSCRKSRSRRTVDSEAPVASTSSLSETKPALADDFRQSLTSFFRKQQGQRLRSFLYLSQSVYPQLDRFQSFSFKFSYEESVVLDRNKRLRRDCRF